MIEQTTAPGERDEIEMLLPWYVTGRLEPEEHARVEAWLERDAGLRRQLDLLREEHHETIAANEALRAPSPGALDRLMASIEQPRPGLAARFGSTSLYQKLAEFFAAPTARGVRRATVAAAALFLVQAAVIGTLLTRGEQTGAYHTASGQFVGKGVSAFVVFSDDARTSAITRALSDFDAMIVDGPKPGGVYKIRIPLAEGTDAARTTMFQRLAERRDVIRSVLPAGD